MLVGLLFILAITSQCLCIPSIPSFPFATRAKPITFPDLYEASVPELQAGLNAGHFTSVDLVKVRRYLASEESLNSPTIRRLTLPELRK